MRYLLGTALAALIAAAPAQAAVFYANLTGSQEVPPNASPATGFGTAEVNDDLTSMTVSISFSGLVGTLVDGHIHCCGGPGVNSPVVVGFPGLPLGSMAGSYFHVFNLTDATTYRAAFLAANGGTAAGAAARLFAGLSGGEAYFNLHSSFRPGGEIRGDILVPEPAALSLFGLGIFAAGLARRRKG